MPRIISLGNKKSAILKLHGSVRDLVKKIPVVRNNYERTAVCAQKVFKPFDSGYIKVIGRLIQKQKVCIGKQQLCKLSLVALPSAERVYASRKLIFGETESEHSGAGARAIG